MPFFGKKKANVPEAPGMMPPGGFGMPAPGLGMPGSNPLIEIVRSMKQQGLNNNQIIQELQRQGYNSQQIFDAINMAEPTNIPAGPIEGSMPEESPDMGMAQSYGAPASQETGREKIEEMAEAIIEEKWEELVKSINKIVEWKSKMEGSISKFEQEIKDLKDNFTQLQNSIVGKIGEYDKNIINVGTQVKAMEQTFEKILPTFTENVGELRRIVKGIKK